MKKNKLRKKWYLDPGGLLLCLVVVLFCNVRNVFGKSLEPILWSIQNKMFSDPMTASQASQHRPTVIEVRIGEFLNLLCPKYSLNESSSSIEFHALHKVSRDEFEQCKINDIGMRHPILKCDRPFETVKYTLYISKFSPVPDAIEFTPGNNYYFISTSNGTFAGLNNDADGSCKTNNMKIIVKVLDSKAASLPKPMTTKERHHYKDTTRIPVIMLSTAQQQHQRADDISGQLFFKKSSSSDTSTMTTTTTKRAVKTVTHATTNDNIFILEPDSDLPVDYGDILSQIIFSSSSSSPSLSSTIKNSDAALSSSEQQQIDDSSSSSRLFSATSCYYVSIVLVLYFFTLR